MTGDLFIDEWTNFYNSSEICTTHHSWDENGSYEISVIAMDEYGLKSEWSDPLSISMPKNKPYINQLFLRFLEQYSRMFPILRYYFT